MKNIVKIENDKNFGLVVSSRDIAKQLGRRHDNIMRDLDKISETSNVRSLIFSSTYKVKGQNRNYKEYLLTKDGFTLYMFNIQGYNEFKIAYINRFNEMERDLAKNKIPQTYKEALLELVKKEEILEETRKTLNDTEVKLEYKENVLIGLVDEIDLKDKRQILNQVVRYKGSNFQERWRALYYEFDKKYHIDIRERMKNYNRNHSPKMRTKLDYIEKIMGKLPELYEIAAKMFAGDIEDIVDDYKHLG